MERIDSIHSSSSSDDNVRNPKPILISSPPSHHQSRRSISGIDILNGLKIMTSGGTSILNNLNDSNIPPSPVPSQLISEHHFSHIDDFDIKEPIGYGSSAIVYKAIYKPSGNRMALKMIDLDKFERNQIDELRRETALMALSKHPNVLRVYGSFVHGSKLYIVTPFLGGGSCLDIMKTRFPNGLDEFSIATILKQALEALLYLHKNGHIHRDVKAGNLLMDDDGSVLLGDFGVSSSLMETGERGMRKTFVGTPCWMAPEVMEQAEYDYKADIWSFGITAIELATGHAPFAKYPPLKVLMMTLSNDPPTLDREGTVHKYSKYFKEMIDTCLSKDPLKRPNAEKLLLHPFFKQAKRKDYLCKTILAELPPLEQRPRKIMPQKQVTIIRTDEWDFDDDEEEEEDLMDANGDPLMISNLGQQGQQPIQQQQQQENSKKATTKRHISFGDVVVRSNSMVHPSDPLPAPSTTSVVGTPPRKSRFVIEETSSRDPTDTYNSSSVRSSSPMLDEEVTHDGEIMKGRFYVNQQNKPFPDPSVAVVSPAGEEDVPMHGLHKIPSQDTLNVTDRKSRFEISSSTSPMMYQPVPLSRDSSSYSSSSNPTSGRSTTTTTAVTEKRYPDTSTLTSENIALLTESSRKIGRFELTGGSACSSVDVTPRGSISSSHVEHPMTHGHAQSHLSIDSNASSPQYQIEELLRFNESQRMILQELSLAFSKKPTAMTTDVVEDTYMEDCQVGEEISSTVEHLDKLIQLTLKENTQLQKENEALRRELKELKSN
ncbi:hypothetical protein INT47_012343 [Mucor saturninus]|uniref:Protein kinase domain-containing protein n=1 Tax=Mucor saturninus TaxID=64648 RepID=A0A8H7V055_9FUNG|nr:hypothetical protein INT47_012343 [Mucor saturninus]